MTYQVLSVNKLIKEQELVEFSQLEQVINWYQENSLTEVSLKNLRRQFPTWSTITKDLENWVKLNLIQRYDGRYRLKLSIINETRFQELSQRAKVASQNLVQKIKTEMPVTEEMDWLVPLVIDVIVAEFNSIVAIEEGLRPKLKIYQQATEDYLYLELGEKNDLGLVAYFKNPKLSPLAQETRQLIGDVNQNYFLTMSGKVMETVIAGEKLRRFKDNIFVQTLGTYKYLSLEDKQPKLNCLVGTLKQTDLATLTAELTKLILNDVIEGPIQSNEEELFTTLKLREVLRLSEAQQFFITVTQ